METFGPNTEAVNGVTERASKLTAGEAEKLAAMLGVAEASELNAAWHAAWDAVLVDGTRLVAWNAAGDDAWVAAWDAAWDAAGDDARDSSWEAARAAARDAAQAAVVRDLISDADYRTLAGPWEAVMGPVFPQH